MNEDRYWTREELNHDEDRIGINLHHYPFKDDVMQNIESHLNPFCALYHARQQIDLAIEKGYIEEETFWSRDPALQLVSLITENWSDPDTVPDLEFMNAAQPRHFRTPSPSPTRPSKKKAKTSHTGKVLHWLEYPA